MLCGGLLFLSLNLFAATAPVVDRAIQSDSIVPPGLGMPSIQVYPCHFNANASGQRFVVFEDGEPGVQYLYAPSRLATHVDFSISENVSDVQMYAAFALTGPNECLLGSIDALSLLVPSVIEDVSSNWGQHFQIPVKTPQGKVVAAYLVAQSSDRSLRCAIIGGPGADPSLHSGGGIHIGSAGDGGVTASRSFTDGIMPTTTSSTGATAVSSAAKCSLSPKSTSDPAALMLMAGFFLLAFAIRRTAHRHS